MEFEKELLAGGKYRELEEIEQWKKKDPIDRYAAQLTKSGVANQSKLDEIEARVAKTVADADKFSHDSEPAVTAVVMASASRRSFISSSTWDEEARSRSGG